MHVKLADTTRLPYEYRHGKEMPGSNADNSSRGHCTADGLDDINLGSHCSFQSHLGVGNAVLPAAIGRQICHLLAVNLTWLNCH